MLEGEYTMAKGICSTTRTDKKDNHGKFIRKHKNKAN